MTVGNGAALNARVPRPVTKPRRRRDRRAVNMIGHLTCADGHMVEVSLIDLSYDGCGIKVPLCLAPDEPVRLSILSRGSISAHVRWSHDGRAGLEFDPLPAEFKTQVERRACRTQVPGEIRLKTLGGNGYRVRLFDLSTEGCKVETVELPSVGDHMLVKFEGIEIMDAQVCWIAGHSVGLKFAKPLHPAVLDLLLRRLTVN